MGLTININTSNAAFQEDSDECARILREIADKLDRWNGYDKFQTIFDANGNDVGRWRLSLKEGE